MPIGTMIVVAIVLIVVAVAAAVLSHFFDSLQPEEQCRIQNRKCRGKGQRDH